MKFENVKVGDVVTLWGRGGYGRWNPKRVVVTRVLKRYFETTDDNVVLRWGKSDGYAFGSSRVFTTNRHYVRVPDDASEAEALAIQEMECKRNKIRNVSWSIQPSATVAAVYAILFPEEAP